MTEVLKRILTAIALVLIFLFALLSPIKWVFAALMLTILSYILFFEWPKLISPRSILFWFATPIYPILPVLLIIALHYYSTRLTLLLFGGAAIFDTAAYCFGNLWGTHKILPMVSPGKSWEGFFGGYITTLIFAKIFFFSPWNLAYTSLGVLIFCTFCLLGDLFESWLKRRANLKDSGSILPGHGGLLDRFDAVFFAVFFVYCFRNGLNL